MSLKVKRQKERERKEREKLERRRQKKLERRRKLNPLRPWDSSGSR